jgi:GTP cyclohydrolase II
LIKHDSYGDTIMITPVADAPLPTDFGIFHIFIFENTITKSQEIALTYGAFHNSSPVLVRLHSACVTSEIFGANNCDCKQQLQEAMTRIVERGSGVILYLAQEGRGNGLVPKVKTLNLIFKGQDTHAAFSHMGYSSDARDYRIAAEMIRALGIKEPIELLTNNPDKVKKLKQYGIIIECRTDLYTPPTNYNIKKYLDTKRDKEGHILPHLIKVQKYLQKKNTNIKKEENSIINSPSNMIVIIGDINLDWYVKNQLSFDFIDLNENGRTENSPIDERVGGTGLNFARFAKQVGYDPILLGSVGSDLSGKFLLDWLETNSINAVVGIKKNLPTGRAFITFDQKNIRLLITSSLNANHYFSFDDIKNSQQIITKTPLLYVSGYCISQPPSKSIRTRATLRVMNLAKREGNAQIVLDVVPHQIYKIYSYAEFQELTIDVDILIAEVATIRRFLGKGKPQEDIGRYHAHQTAELLAQSYDRFILRYGPSGIDMQITWDKHIGKLIFESTGYDQANDKRGYGDLLTLKALKEVFKFGFPQDFTDKDAPDPLEGSDHNPNRRLE